MATPHLPAEILDRIVDHLHDAGGALRNCCLVSKSWIPRTRKHLFADITIRTEDDLKSWKETFPDPSSSLACYTRTLSVQCPYAITDVDAEAGWIRGFFRAAHLEVVGNRTAKVIHADETKNSLVSLHGFSPAIKSLRVYCIPFSSSQILDFVLSFPLLEDLAVLNPYDVSTGDLGGLDGLPTAVQPSNLPAFTGFLELFQGGMDPISRWLLALPGRIHFRELRLSWIRDGDLSLTTRLVEGCSSTLKSLDITCIFHVGLGLGSFSLSKATNLRDVIFRPTSLGIEWITIALQTITPGHRNLQRISIHVPYYLTCAAVNANVKHIVGEAFLGQWSELDRLLVRLWESRSILPKVIHPTMRGGPYGTKDFIGHLLPEMMKREMITLVY